MAYVSPLEYMEDEQSKSETLILDYNQDVVKVTKKI